MTPIFSRITGTGSALPDRVLTNADLEKIVDTTDEWIQSRTGIRERHVVAEGETTADLAVTAALRALEAAGVKASELDLIVLGTTTPDIIFPSTACLVQHRIGANGCAAFDVNAACSGFMYALGIADKFIKCGQSKKVLVIGAETLTAWSTDRARDLRAVRRRRWRGRAGSVGEPGIYATCLHADGGHKDLLYNPVGVSAGSTGVMACASACPGARCSR
jgi:3-oxoacyl-[acyl-carrier-protein] synthase-3